jgi:hypothetical protein
MREASSGPGSAEVPKGEQEEGPSPGDGQPTPETPTPEPQTLPGTSRWLRDPRIQGLAAFLLYLAAWLAAMGPKILHHMNDRILSAIPQEASIFVWSFAWWPHALTHAANPLLSNAVWAPTGINLAWATTPPGPSLVAAPVTLLSGPVAAFNVMGLLTPPITAWAAYLFARRLSGSFFPALAGGAMFGFSPVVMREIVQGHLNLSLLFLLPLAGYLVVRRVQGSMGRRAFVLLMTAVLVGEFCIFAEIFATMAVVGGLVAVAAFFLAPKEARDLVIDTARLTALSFGFAVVVVAPYLLTAFAYPKASKPGEFRGLAIGLRHFRDLRRYAIPGPGFVIGPRTEGFGDLNFWYLGLPLLVVLVVFWITARRSFVARLLAAGFVIALVLSWGRELPFDHRHIPLPWAIFDHLPLLGRARAGRMIAYAFLFASGAVAVWLAQAKGKRWDSIVRWGAVGVALAFLVPNVRVDSWTSNVAPAPFFASGGYRHELCQNEVVLVVAAPAKQVLWQSQTHLYFRTVGWYPGFRPEDYVDLPAALRFQRGLITPNDGPTLHRFLAEHQVSAIIVGAGQTYATQQLQSLLGIQGQRIGGVTLLRLAPCAATRGSG